MKITEDVRRYAAEHGVSEDAAVEAGLNAKAKVFTQSAGDVYARA